MKSFAFLIVVFLSSCYLPDIKPPIKADTQYADSSGKSAVRVIEVGRKDQLLKKYESIYERSNGVLHPIDLRNLKAENTENNYVAFHYLGGKWIEFYPEYFFREQFPTKLDKKQSFTPPDLVSAGQP